MATWFATAAGNINSAGRWKSAPDGSGSTLTWPPDVGDALVANGYTITVNVSVNLGSSGTVRTDNGLGGSAGGVFQFGAGPHTITANVISGSTNCVLASNDGFIVGNVTGGSSASQFGVRSQTSNLTITGTVTGGSGTAAHGVRNDFGGTLTIIGESTAGTGGSAAANIGAGTIAITGAVKGTSQIGVRNDANGTVTVVGSVDAGSGAAGFGARNLGVGSLSITGNLTASSAAFGAQNDSSGTLTVSGYAQASTAFSAINTGLGIVTVGETRSASNGRPVVIGAFRYADNGNNRPKLRVDGRAVKYLEFDGTDFLTLTASPSLGSSAVVCLATSTGVTRLDNVPVGTRYRLPGTPASGTVNVYGYLVLPAAPSAGTDTRIRAYLTARVGL